MRRFANAGLSDVSGAAFSLFVIPVRLRLLGGGWAGGGAGGGGGGGAK